MKNIICYAFLTGLLIFQVACDHPSKHNKTPSSATPNTMPNAKNLSQEQVLLNNVDARLLQVKTFQSQAQISVKTPDINQSLSADIRLQSGQKIWAALYTDFGIRIEVGRILITPDSVQVVNRFQKQYYTEKISYLQRLIGYPLTFADLEAIILGHRLNLPQTSDTLHTKHLNGTLIELYHRSNNMPTSTQIDTTQYQIQQIKLEDLFNDRQVQQKLNNYQIIGNKNFATQRQIIFTSQQKDYKATLLFTDPQLNPKLEFPFVISKNYERIK